MRKRARQPKFVWPAYRALVRVLRPRLRSLDFAEHADAQFDGGEFSVHPYVEARESVECHAIVEVAQRFGVASEDLRYTYEVAPYHEERIMMEEAGYQW